MFVVDAADPGRFERCRSVLGGLLEHPSLEAVPLLLLGTKSDQRGAATSTQLFESVCRGLGLGAAADAPPGGGVGPRRDFRLMQVSSKVSEGEGTGAPGGSRGVTIAPVSVALKWIGASSIACLREREKSAARG